MAHDKILASGKVTMTTARAHTHSALILVVVLIIKVRDLLLALDHGNVALLDGLELLQYELHRRIQAVTLGQARGGKGVRQLSEPLFPEAC